MALNDAVFLSKFGYIFITTMVTCLVMVSTSMTLH